MIRIPTIFLNWKMVCLHMGMNWHRPSKDGYLVDFLSIESSLKFIEEGIVYDELSEEDKEAYEATFEDENGELPEKISSSALNSWLFNEDTIKKVLHILMTQRNSYQLWRNFRKDDYLC